jgi:hypothetical protein
MAIDPVRLARIRARLLAASTLVVPACGGGVPEHVNARPIEHVNVAPPDPKPEDPPAAKPGDDTSKPNAPPAEELHINRPNPDQETPKPPPTTAKDVPPSGQTINVAKDDKAPYPHTINTVQSRPTGPVAKPVKPVEEHINTPKPN